MSRPFRNICLLVLHGIVYLPVCVNGQAHAAMVHFKSFNTEVLYRNTIQLNWEITGEVATGTYFIVERSADGVIFQPLNKAVMVPQTGEKGYRYIDHFGLTDSAFYRVVVSGAYTPNSISAVQQVKQAAKPVTEVIIMPNPVFNNASLIINDESLGDISCILYDMSGKKIRTYQFRKTTGYLQQILDMYSVPKGAYVLTIQGNSLYESKRILKQ